MAEVLPGRVGETKLILGTTIPPGFLSICDGQEVSRSQYSELWEWATENTSVQTDLAWNTEFATNGTNAKFSSGDGTSTFRLPAIRGIISSIDISNNATFTKASYSTTHYHAFGSWENNNGVWPAKAYSDATFPDGTQGVFWNGGGGGSWPTQDTPPTSGHYITSNNMGDTVSNDIRPATVNLTLCIRYTTSLQDTAAQTAASQVMQAAEELANAVNTTATVTSQDTLLENTGYSITSDGFVQEWGTTPVGRLSGDVVFPVALASGTTPFNISTTLVEPSTKSATVAITSMGNLGFSYECTDLALDSYVMWSIQGRV